MATVDFNSPILNAYYETDPGLTADFLELQKVLSSFLLPFKSPLTDVIVLPV